jgi:hypothetical protein
LSTGSWRARRRIYPIPVGPLRFPVDGYRAALLEPLERFRHAGDIFSETRLLCDQVSARPTIPALTVSVAAQDDENPELLKRKPLAEPSQIEERKTMCRVDMYVLLAPRRTRPCGRRKTYRTSSWCWAPRSVWRFKIVDTLFAVRVILNQRSTPETPTRQPWKVSANGVFCYCGVCSAAFLRAPSAATRRSIKRSRSTRAIRRVAPILKLGNSPVESSVLTVVRQTPSAAAASRSLRANAGARCMRLGYRRRPSGINTSSRKIIRPF